MSGRTAIVAIQLVRLSTAALFVVALLLAGMQSAGAAAAAQNDDCTIVLGPIDPETGGSPILSNSCTTSTSASPATITPDTETKLETFFRDEDYGGPKVVIYGSDGTCDQSGYGVNNMDPVIEDLGGGVSSFRMFGNCNTADVCDQYNHAGICGYFYSQNISYVTNRWNDNILSFYDFYRPIA